MRAQTFSSMVVLTMLATIAGGCYEDAGGGPPPAPQPSAGVQEGPLTELSRGGPGVGPALGKAKKTASNIAEQAEQKSREIADQADDPLSDKPRRDPAPADDPG